MGIKDDLKKAEQRKNQAEKEIAKLKADITIKNVTGLTMAIDDLKERIEEFYGCDIATGVKIDGDNDAVDLKRHIKKFATDLVKMTHSANHVIAKGETVTRFGSKQYGDFDADKLHGILLQEGITTSANDGAGKWITMKEVRHKLFGDAEISIRPKHLPINRHYGDQFVSNGLSGTARKITAC